MRESLCTGCQHRALVNLAVRQGKNIGEFCAECYERLNLAESPRKHYRSSRGTVRPNRDDIARVLDEE